MKWVDGTLKHTRQEKSFANVTNTSLVFLVKSGLSAQTMLEQSRQQMYSWTRNANKNPQWNVSWPSVYSGGCIQLLTIMLQILWWASWTDVRTAPSRKPCPEGRLEPTAPLDSYFVTPSEVWLCSRSCFDCKTWTTSNDVVRVMRHKCTKSVCTQPAKTSWRQKLIEMGVGSIYWQKYTSLWVK